MIQRFCSISGQMTNLQKSFVKFSPNASEDKQIAYKSKLRMESKDNIGQYLGTPVDIQDYKVRHFTY